VKLTVYNQYDFTNLKALSGKWFLYKNRELYEKGTLQVNCDPHDTVNITLPDGLPEKLGENIWFLHLNFSDKNKMPVYEHSINLVLPDRFVGIKKQLCKNRNNNRLKIEKSDNGLTTISNKDFIYEIGRNTLSLDLSTQNKNIPLISNGIYARVGRIPKMVDITVRDKFHPKTGDYFWDPCLLKPSEIKKQVELQDSGKYCFSAYGTFLRGENFKGQKIEGEILYTIENTGALIVYYNLKPVHATGVFLDAGISFMLPSRISNFLWLGDGPYSSYPDKHRLNDFGIHLIKKGDINFNGNRRNVELAVLTDNQGNGIALLCDKSNISVELRNNQIIVSNNSFVSGEGNKKNMPITLIKAEEVSEIEGKITIIPLNAGRWPKKIKDILGYPDKSLKAFNPFYYSYDTSI